jgi:hypothetical protein
MQQAEIESVHVVGMCQTSGTSPVDGIYDLRSSGSHGPGAPAPDANANDPLLVEATNGRRLCSAAGNDLCRRCVLSVDAHRLTSLDRGEVKCRVSGGRREGRDGPRGQSQSHVDFVLQRGRAQEVLIRTVSRGGAQNTIPSGSIPAVPMAPASAARSWPSSLRVWPGPPLPWASEALRCRAILRAGSRRWR